MWKFLYWRKIIFRLGIIDPISLLKIAEPNKKSTSFFLCGSGGGEGARGGKKGAGKKWSRNKCINKIKIDKLRNLFQFVLVVLSHRWRELMSPVCGIFFLIVSSVYSTELFLNVFFFVAVWKYCVYNPWCFGGGLEIALSPQTLFYSKTLSFYFQLYKKTTVQTVLFRLTVRNPVPTLDSLSTCLSDCLRLSVPLALPRPYHTTSQPPFYAGFPLN